MATNEEKYRDSMQAMSFQLNRLLVELRVLKLKFARATRAVESMVESTEKALEDRLIK